MYFGYGLDILQTTAKVSQVTNVRLNRAPLVFIKPRKKESQATTASTQHSTVLYLELSVLVE